MLWLRNKTNNKNNYALLSGGLIFHQYFQALAPFPHPTPNSGFITTSTSQEYLIEFSPPPPQHLNIFSVPCSQFCHCSPVPFKLWRLIVPLFQWNKFSCSHVPQTLFYFTKFAILKVHCAFIFYRILTICTHETPKRTVGLKT